MNESTKVQRSKAVEIAQRFTEQVPHNSDLGIQVVSVDDGKVCMRLVPRLWMSNNSANFEISTSILFSLADSACGLAVFAEVQELVPIATLNLQTNYLKPATSDRPTLAIATCHPPVNDVAFICCEIFAEGEDIPLVKCSATFIRNYGGPNFKVSTAEREST